MTNKHKKKRKRKIKEQQQAEQSAGKNQRRTIRHNVAANQEKHRLDWQPLTPDEEGVIADRRIMPRDELDRREGLLISEPLSFDETMNDAAWQDIADETPFLLGKVVEVSRGLCRAEVNGEVMVCDLRGILTAEGTGYTNILAVGDRVLVQMQTESRGLVEKVLPRRSGLAHADTFDVHLKQIIAANVDQLLIVASWREPHIWFQMVDEYLIGAERNNLQAVICINKVDLADSLEEVVTAVSPYHSLNHTVHFTSADVGIGIDGIRDILDGRTTVLAGLSGVGKSSLLNAAYPGFHLRTSEVSKLKSREGRHTTTQAILLNLPDGGAVVDTPGIKDMGLSGLHPDDLITYYPDVEAVEACKFSDCTHSHEPGCGVKKAVENGRLAEWRHANYVNLYSQLADEL